MCLADGVTGWIDAGSQGADRIADTVAVAQVVAAAGPRADQHRPRRHPARRRHDGPRPRRRRRARATRSRKNRDFIVGVKARLSRDVAGANDVEVLRRAQEVATAFDLPVMIHMGQTSRRCPGSSTCSKRGDIVTHLFAPPPNSIVDDSGRILPEVLAARRRGIWFDVGNGQTGHMRWDIVERDHEGGLLARHVLHRLERQQPDDRRRRSSRTACRSFSASACRSTQASRARR